MSFKHLVDGVLHLWTTLRKTTTTAAATATAVI